MAATTAALDLTTRYRAGLLRLRMQTARLALLAWPTVTDDLDAAFAGWATTTEALVRQAKVQGVTLADGYLAAYIGAELGRHAPAQGIDPEAYMDTEDGRPLGRALLPPTFTAKAALADGRRDALQLGAARMTRLVAEETLGAPRRALADLMQAEDRVAGWRRVTGSRACGACLAMATGAVLQPGERLHRHGHCRCSAEPVIRGVRERFLRPTGRDHFNALPPAEQAALFHGRGGEEKADLVRSGAVPFDALVRHEHQEVAPDQYTETSLADLRALANRP